MWLEVHQARIQPTMANTIVWSQPCYCRLPFWLYRFLSVWMFIQSVYDENQRTGGTTWYCVAEHYSILYLLFSLPLYYKVGVPLSDYLCCLSGQSGIVDCHSRSLDFCQSGCLHSLWSLGEAAVEIEMSSGIFRKSTWHPKFLGKLKKKCFKQYWGFYPPCCTAKSFSYVLASCQNPHGTGCLKKTDTQILQNAILLGKIDQKRCKLQNT